MTVKLLFSFKDFDTQLLWWQRSIRDSPLKVTSSTEMTKELRNLSSTPASHLGIHFDSRWDGACISEDQWHFHRQLLRRYRIVLCPGDFSVIMASIQDGRAVLVEARGKGHAIYSVRVPSAKERIYVLVADKKHVITAWPPTKRLNDSRRAILAKERGCLPGHE